MRIIYRRDVDDLKASLTDEYHILYIELQPNMFTIIQQLEEI